MDVAYPNLWADSETTQLSEISENLKSPAPAEGGDGLQVILAGQGAEPAEPAGIGTDIGGDGGPAFGPVGQNPLAFGGGFVQSLGQMNRVGSRNGLPLV